VQRHSVPVTIAVCVTTVVLMFVGIKALAIYLAPTDLPPPPPVDKARLPKPQTIGEASCCIGDGDGYCATAYHGEVNGIRYYAARKLRGCYAANVATEKTVSTRSFDKLDERDFCSCGKDFVFIPAAQLFKASLSTEEMLVSSTLQENGLPRFISPNEQLQPSDSTHVLRDDVVARLDDGRWFRLFKIESYGEADRKPAIITVVRFGQELDPSTKPNAAKDAKLVDKLGCFWKIQVDTEVFFVLTRGANDKPKN
jgi:hypothetical protein